MNGMFRLFFGYFKCDLKIKEKESIEEELINRFYFICVIFVRVKNDFIL